MNKFLVSLSFVMCLFLVACGGGGNATTITNTDPVSVAKGWMGALFTADETTLKNTTCTAQQATITADLMATTRAGLSLATVDPSEVVYTFDEANGVMKLSGMLKLLPQGQTQPIDFPITEYLFTELLMVKESDTWKVCMDLGATMGG